jgi:NADH dehydrogenase
MPFSYVAGANDIETTDRQGMRHLIDAAKAAGVRKFVYTSFSGNIDRTFPLRDAKRQVERWLVESGLDWTILRPSYFMEVWLTPAVGFDPANGRVTIYGGGTEPVSWISVKDVAAFAGSALDAQQASRATLEIGGAPLTPMEVVGIFETRLHQRIELMFVPTAALDEQEAAAADPMQRSFVALMRCLADGDAIELGRTRELIGRQPITVEAYAATTAPIAGVV